jgi:hypothetical protein
MHDATKVLWGTVGSSDRVVTKEDANPASFPAGRAVRGKSDGTISLSSADGYPKGISLGKDLANVGKTAVCRAGNEVPIALAEYLVKAELTFVSKRPGIPIAIEFLDSVTAGSEAATVTGNDADGYLISLAMDGTGTKSTATQCKTALDASAPTLALIETQVASGQGSTQQSAFAEDDIDSLPAVKGAAVRVSDVTGLAIPSGGTLTKAKYLTGTLTGVDAFTGVETPAAKVDMGGGL